MKYENANEILPENLLIELKKYAAGKLLYVPLDSEKKTWGELSGYRNFLIKRNQMIVNKFHHGVSIRDLSIEYYLSEDTIKKIIYSKKITQKLSYYPTVSSALEFSEAGMLEEWLHTYLLFKRKNKLFSDGLRLQYRYYIGPTVMPLTLFRRCSGPEADMKWQVHADVFEEKVDAWIECIKKGDEIPPFIINFEKEVFEINCDNPLLEAMLRLGIKQHYVIIWITENDDKCCFLKSYSSYI